MARFILEHSFASGEKETAQKVALRMETNPQVDAPPHVIGARQSRIQEEEASTDVSITW